MEIDLSTIRSHQRVALGLLLAVLALGTLGARYTPQSGPAETRLLTWQEWQVIRSQQAYATEVTRMRQAADELAQLLDEPPDPVRAQLLAERVQDAFESGVPASAFAREKLIAAANRVQEWAAGALPREAAVQALQTAQNALRDPGESE